MSPKPLDPEVRTALIEAAARLLAEDGPGALTTRRLAAEVGTSTMAVYTYFKGMDELRHAVRLEGFDRLAAFLEDVPVGDDPLGELVDLGGAYFTNAITNPHLYRFMFMEKPIDDDPEVGIGTFERLVAGVDRAVKAKVLDPGDPWDLAQQLWASTHGVVTLYLAGLFTLEEALSSYQRMGFFLLIGMGVDPEALVASVADTRRRFADIPAWGGVDVPPVASVHKRRNQVAAADPS
jgi:AcrR family transcriptional regulator